MVIATNFHL